MMNEKETKQLSVAFARMDGADLHLQKTVSLLAKFGTDVPPLNAKALKMMCETVNSLDKSIDFIKSFIRVSTLQQIVPKKTKGGQH